MNETAELWRQADAIFDRLLDIAAEQRAAALSEMRLAAPLHAAVTQLLAAHAAASGVLDRQAPAPNSAAAGDSLQGKRLGRWQLEREIGRGGMSVVYRATASDASGQVAAVKLLTLGAMAGRGDESFRQEQALLARLRHSHIATLFEAGVAEDGTPWLAMALVDGTRIDTWCAERGLDPRAIVRLFLDVCDAVAYAHRNLVIHRDLKPSNVLVDDSGEVRLVDFGIARLIDAEAERTASQWRALTPEYAAPEQFGGAPPSTAMDVYGLGALLFRLLVGRPPRTSADGTERALTAPSKALRGTRAAAAIKGDLDAIVLKALAHDPAERYESVTALAQDLNAWLERRPVAAQAPRLTYRVAKFVARHKVGVAASVAVLFAVLLGLATALWQAERARLAAFTAQTEAARALQQAERATAIQAFVLSLFQAADPEQAGGAAQDSRAMLRHGVARLEKRADLATDIRVEILTTIGAAQRTMAWYDDAQQSLSMAATLADADTSVAALLRAGVRHQQGLFERVQNKNAAALDYFATAETALQGVNDAAADEQRVRIRTQRGTALAELGRYNEAMAEFAAAAPTLAALSNAAAETRIMLDVAWGSAAYGAGDYATALEKLRSAYALQRRPENAGNASISLTLNHLSGASAMMGLLDDAVRYDGEAVAIARQAYPADHPQIAEAVYAYGDTLRQAGRFAEGLVALNEARAIRDRNGELAKRAMVDFTRVRVQLALGQYAEAVVLAAAIRPALEQEYGVASTVILQLTVQEIAALSRHDPEGRLLPTLQRAARVLDQLSEELRWHSVAQFLRWRIARAHQEQGDLDAAQEWLAKTTERPASMPSHVTTDLVLSALRLRLAGADAAGAATQSEALGSLRAELETAQGASTEALAYGWLSIAAVAELREEAVLVEQALAAIEALHRRQPLPAEYLVALTSWRKGAAP